jgi:hypothetical protein
VLVGAAGWLVGCFLPLFGAGDPVEHVSFSRQIMFGSTWNDIGGLLYLFGGICAIFVISIDHQRASHVRQAHDGLSALIWQPPMTSFPASSSHMASALGKP